MGNTSTMHHRIWLKPILGPLTPQSDKLYCAEEIPAVSLITVTDVTSCTEGSKVTLCLGSDQFLEVPHIIDTSSLC